MACELYRSNAQQTLQERKRAIKKAVTALEQALAMKTIKPVIGPQGAITFAGWNAGRDGVTDACAYRHIMTGNASLAKLAISQAETLAGRTVDRAIVGQGVHSHDGGRSWDKH
jgi:hypothetical protein